MKFSRLADYLERLEATSSRNEITAILSELFRQSGANEIDKITYLLSGSLAPNYKGINFNIAEKLMFQILAKAFDQRVESVKKAFKEKGDLGEVAESLSRGGGKDPEVADVYQKMLEIAQEEGGGSQERKITKMAELLASLSPKGARYAARIPVGNLRLGFSEMTILDALSVMVRGDKSARPQIEAAFNVSVDIGKIAKEVKERGLPGLAKVKPEAGTPIRPSLAERLPSAEKILEKVGPKVAIEPKFDGLRCITGFTPIYTRDRGYISVKDIKVGDYVLTHKGRFNRVLAINKRKINKKESLYRLQTYLANEFKISAGHKILVWKGNRSRWLPVDEVATGDELIFPKVKFSKEKNLAAPNPHLRLGDSSGYEKTISTDSDFYRLLGFWIGLTFNAKQEQALAKEYRKIIQTKLGIPKVSENYYNGSLNVYWRDKPFREWLTLYFRREWKGKALPLWFTQIKKKNFLSFLKGWIESDGTPRHAGGFRISTKERDLAVFVQLLGLHFEKVIGIRRIRNKIKSRDFVDTYYELIIPGTEKRARILGDKILVKILRKEKIKRPDPRTTLYNLQVDKDESYCTGMAALHNCQIHIFEKQGKKEVRLYSRNLENTTSMFPDLVEAVSKINVDSAIFDAEAIGVDPKTGKFLPFQETAQRKRKYDIEAKARKLPLKLFIFDILFKNGTSLLDKPFSERRKILEETVKKDGKVEITRQKIVDNPAEIRSLQKKYLAEGLEGALIKKIDAAYKAGARGYHWVKYKKTTEGGVVDTIDCLVMGSYKGRGKRAGFGVGAFLVGVKEGEKFKTVSKIGTGLTDEQWRELNKRTKELAVPEKPKEYEVDKNLTPDTWTKPSLVVEILADEISKSPVHTAGLALRFPRLIRFRDEKDPREATTLSELTKLYKLQRVAS